MKTKKKQGNDELVIRIKWRNISILIVFFIIFFMSLNILSSCSKANIKESSCDETECIIPPNTPTVAVQKSPYDNTEILERITPKELRKNIKKKPSTKKKIFDPKRKRKKIVPIKSKLRNTRVFRNLKVILHRLEAPSTRTISNRGYLGKYQFGATALKQVKFVKKTVKKNSDLKYSRNWVDGMNKHSFLISSKLQDEALLRLATSNMRILGDKYYRRGTCGRVGLLASAHLIGARGVLKSMSRTDGNNISGWARYNTAKNMCERLNIK